MNWWPSFVEELQKIAEALPKSERNKQYLRYGALGATAGPIISGTANLVERGTLVPKNVQFRQWLPAQMLAGALVGGALPAVREGLTERSIDQWKKRQEAAKELKQLTPEGPSAAINALRPQAPLVEL